MHRDLRVGLGGLMVGFAAGAGLGSAPLLSPGSEIQTEVQPEQESRQLAGAQPELPADPIARELALIRAGLFREESELPTDPARSIEQMLEEQSRAIASLGAKIAAAAPEDDGRAIERRIADLELALGEAAGEDAAALERDVKELRRLLDDLDRRVENVPGSDLGELARTVQELQRRMSRVTDRSIDSLESSLRSAESQIRTLESRVRTLERKIP